MGAVIVPEEIQIKMVEYIEKVHELQKQGNIVEAISAIHDTKASVRLALDTPGLDILTRARLGDWMLQLDMIKIRFEEKFLPK